MKKITRIVHFLQNNLEVFWPLEECIFFLAVCESSPTFLRFPCEHEKSGAALMNSKRHTLSVSSKILLPNHFQSKQSMKITSRQTAVGCEIRRVTMIKKGLWLSPPHVFHRGN